MAPWRDYVTLPDVALVALDQAVTTISLDETSPLQAAAGSVVSDTDGVRQALLIFPADRRRRWIAGWHRAAADDTACARDRVHRRRARATGHAGTLPAESGYTYAVDYSVDEALAAGARQVRFSQPVIGYVENFLHFPVGEAVPVAHTIASGPPG